MTIGTGGFIALNVVLKFGDGNMSNILVIPDSHCKPEASNRRFDWLGNLIADKRPDVVVHLGDFYDMGSLCSYDKGKAGFVSKNYKGDIDAGHDASDRMFARLRASKKKVPRRVFCEGNHEYRYHRLLDYEPQLKGELRAPAPPGWEYNGFLVPVDIDGVTFQHYFVSGVMARAISGEHPAASIVKQHMISAVSGHSHLIDYAERTRSNGEKVQSLVAGCFLDEDQVEDYAKPVQHMWRNCVSYLHDVREGNYDLELISYERLKKEYA